MTLAAGLISMEDQACQVIVINLLQFCYMFGSGMQTTMCTLVGNQIGKGEAFQALRYFYKILYVALALFGFLSYLVWFFYEDIIRSLTDLKDIQE